MDVDGVGGSVSSLVVSSNPGGSSVIHSNPEGMVRFQMAFYLIITLMLS